MKKIVINRCYGGFGMSTEGVMRYAENKGITLHAVSDGTFITHYTTVPAKLEKNDKFGLGELVTADGKKLPDNAYFSVSEIERDDPALVKAVEELGAKASGKYAELAVVEIPDDVQWEIEEYDGLEWISEQHRRWS